MPRRTDSQGGKVVLVELKNPNGKGKLSEIQKRQIKKLTDAGIEALIIDTQKEVDDVIKKFPKG